MCVYRYHIKITFCFRVGDSRKKIVKFVIFQEFDWLSTLTKWKWIYKWKLEDLSNVFNTAYDPRGHIQFQMLKTHSKKFLGYKQRIGYGHKKFL